MYTITVGAWYPRTTLHMTEVYRFLQDAHSDLSLDRFHLMRLQKALNLRHVSQQTTDFEHIQARTQDNIELSYYEDGLYTLEYSNNSIPKAEARLKEYLEEKLNPALSYLFSLGAPTPKILAKMNIRHPLVVSMSKQTWKAFQYSREEYGQVYSQIESKGITVYKTPLYIFVVHDHQNIKTVRDLIEMQIFFREFKEQLAKYLNIHRVLWEEISAIKERKTISSKELGILRSKLDSYQKTISLITNRINQMNAYVVTRSKIARSVHVEAHLNTLFQYKFESLTDSHTYIKEIWRMTTDYVNSAIQIVGEIQSQSTQRSIQSLQLITLANVVGTLLTKMAMDTLPGITGRGIGYVIFIIFAAWIINRAVVEIFRRTQYRIHFPEHTRL